MTDLDIEEGTAGAMDPPPRRSAPGPSGNGPPTGGPPGDNGSSDSAARLSGEAASGPPWPPADGGPGPNGERRRGGPAERRPVPGADEGPGLEDLDRFERTEVIPRIEAAGRPGRRRGRGAARQPDRTERIAWPAPGERTERVERVERGPSHAGGPERRKASGQPSQPGQPGEPGERTERIERGERPGGADRASRAEGSGRPESAGRPEQADRTGRPDRTGRTERRGRADRREAADQRAAPDQTQRIERPGRSGPPSPRRAEPLAQPFPSAFMNSFTQTVDLTALRRRLVVEDADADAAARPAAPRLYGRSRPAAAPADAEGTQVLYRTPARSRKRPRPEGLDGPARFGARPPPAAPPHGTGWRQTVDPGRELGTDPSIDLDLADVDPRLDLTGPVERFDRAAALEQIEGPAQGADVGAADDYEAGGSSRSRAIWTLVDQVISSGTNSILMFVVGREVTRSQFGAFSAAFAVFAVVIGFSKAAGGQPLGIKYSGVARRAFVRASAAATGSALVLGLIVGAGCVLAGALFGGAVGSSLVALGVVLPGLLLQDLWRQVFFAQGRPAAAAANDSVWAVVQIVGIYLLLFRHVALASPLLLAWGASAAVAALIGVVQAGFWPAPLQTMAWIREHRDINVYLAAEFVTIQGALNASLLLIGGIGAIELVGALRGVQVVLGPTTIFAVGIVSWAIPEFSRRRDMTAAARMRAAYLLSAVIAGTGILWGLAFLTFGQIKVGGMPIGEHLLGATWAGTHHLLGLSIIQQAGNAATVGVSCMLIAMGRAKQTFRINVFMAPQLLLYPVIGVVVGDGVGAVCGFIVANWIAVPFWYRLLSRAAREAEQEWNDERDRREWEPEPEWAAPASKHLSVE